MPNTGPPRPKQNSEGGKKKPSANPDGGAASAKPDAPPAPPQGPTLGPPNTAPPSAGGAPPGAPGAAPMGPTPGQMQVGQLASQFQGAPGIPNTPGAGVPEGLQSFPNDAAALMNLMKQGYAPGADNFMHAQAQNAHAIARAQEAAAQSQANDQMLKEQNAAKLGALLQQLMLSGTLPHPADAAMAATAGGPPQLSSGLQGPPGQPGPPQQGPPPQQGY